LPASSVAVSAASPEQAAIEAEQLRRAQACMRRLPEQQQEILAYLRRHAQGAQ